MIKIEYSPKFMQKFMESMFTKLDLSWSQSFIRWLIDSKYRTKVRLDKFLDDQLNNPSDELSIMGANFMQIKDLDERIIAIMRFVHANVKYKYDIDNYGLSEYWASAKEVWDRKFDDCDGQNSLIYIIAIHALVPPELLWNCIGKMSGDGGHYWLVYYSMRKQDLYVIDSTYLFNSSKIDHRPEFRLTDYAYKEIWYAFNHKICFTPKPK